MDVRGVTDTSSIVVPDPLTSTNVGWRRASANVFVGGVAAFASSDMFKLPVCELHWEPPGES